MTCSLEDARNDLERLREIVKPDYPAPQELKYMGTIFLVGPPLDVPREWLYKWAFRMDKLRNGEDPRSGRWTKRWYK